MPAVISNWMCAMCEKTNGQNANATAATAGASAVARQVPHEA